MPVIMLCLLTCGSSDDDSPTSPEPQDAGLYDSQGNSADQLVGGQSAYWIFDGLTPRTQYDFSLVDDAQEEIAIARLTSDGDGFIPLTAIGYDLGFAVGTPAMTPALKWLSPMIATYTLTVSDLDGNLVDTYGFTVDATLPMVFAADQYGDGINSFLRTQHPVYAAGRNMTPNTDVDLYVVDDVTNWIDEMSLVDVSGGKETATVDGNGEFLTRVWSSPSLVAPYDIVADVNRNGIFDADTDFIDGYYPVGFMVQTYASGGDIQVQIACDSSNDYKDIFQTSDHVYAKLNPSTQQFTHKWVHKYVVVHQDEWNTGDQLVDVSRGSEYDTPQYGCTNEGRVRVWSSPLSPGKYDIIIDVNRNGVYDEGLDFLDNIDSYGLPTAGFVVPGGDGDAPEVTITSPADNSESADRVVYLQGTVSDESITNARLFVNGAAQTIGVTTGQLDNTPIVLQRGENTIKVEAFNQYGLGSAQIKVEGTFGTVGMNVNLTWNVGPDNDVDLWVQDPTGEWCGWSNDRSDIGGWLDVDDVDGWGPENFYLGKSAMDSVPGNYNVAVHYWSDAGEGPTTPTLRILLNEGQANQIQRTIEGPVLEGSGDWWYATTIAMPAGTFSDFDGPGPAARTLPDSKKR